MTGTILNTVAIVAGGLLGMLLGNRLSRRMRDTVMSGLGLAIVLIGLQMALKTGSVLILLGSILLGGIIGELLNIEAALERLGKWLEAGLHRCSYAAGSLESAVAEETAANDSRFSRGFTMASLLYCVGPMAILGAMQDGLAGDYSTLAVKAVLDGFASLAFASSLGLGIVFSAVPVFLYQGTLTLGAFWIKDLLTDPMIVEMTAVGGLLIVGIGINILDLKRVRVGNLLPALFFAPLIVGLLALV